ncbi:MAG: putative toxin-antitoxin system toxin component, PIN family [Fibrobacter sp.]|nr:putative toxin-antitoxin system toxin component, PIN family [Fibrobacter sp.]
MKVFIDTNILISAALNPTGTPALAYQKAVLYPNTAVICDVNLVELRRIFNIKFPHKLTTLELFINSIISSFEVVDTPSREVEDETRIRDINDRPILRAAKLANVDILLTGDKDFLESNITDPRIMTASEFLKSV